MTGLRQRLLSLLENALAQLAEAETVDPGLLRLIADAGGVLKLLDQLETGSAIDDATDERGHARVA